MQANVGPCPWELGGTPGLARVRPLGPTRAGGVALPSGLARGPPFQVQKLDCAQSVVSGMIWALRRLHFSLGNWTAGKAWFRAWPGSVAAPFFQVWKLGSRQATPFQVRKVDCGQSMVPGMTGLRGGSVSVLKSGLRAKRAERGFGHDWLPWRLHFRLGNWVPGKQLHFSIGNWTAGKACFRAWLGCVAAPFQFWRLGKWDPGRQRTKNATDPIARGRCPIARATCGKPA